MKLYADLVPKNSENTSPHCGALALSSPDLKLPIQTEKKMLCLITFCIWEYKFKRIKGYHQQLCLIE